MSVAGRGERVTTERRQMVWMDSGAFSAFTLGEQQSLPHYCEWLKKHARYIDHYAVLDVIGSAEGTWEAQNRMEDAGLTPVPCFHYGEDPKWLIKYLLKGHDQIALGGMVPINKRDLFPWLDELFDNYLTNAEGEPVIKVHGFGLTTFELMSRYPWYSVDSSAWLQVGAFGSIVYTRDGKPWRVQVSGKSPRTADAGQHYNTETPANQAAIRKEVERYGFTMEELINQHWSRREFCAVTYDEYARVLKLREWSNPEASLFTMAYEEASYGRTFGPNPSWPWPQMTMYLAGMLDMAIEEFLYTKRLNRMFTYHAQKVKPTPMWKAVMDIIDGVPFPSYTPPKRKE